MHQVIIAENGTPIPTRLTSTTKPGQSYIFVIRDKICYLH